MNEDDLIKMVEEQANKNKVTTEKKAPRKINKVIVWSCIILVVLILWYSLPKYTTHGGTLTINNQNVSIPNAARLDLLVDGTTHWLVTPTMPVQKVESVTPVVNEPVVAKTEPVKPPKPPKYEGKITYKDGCVDYLIDEKIVTDNCHTSRQMNVPGVVS